MEMTYGGALVMPSSYAVMDEEEMMYLEGGFGIYLKNHQVADLILGFMCAYSTIPRVVAAGALVVSTACSAATSKIISLAGSLFGATVGSFVGWWLGAYCGWEFGKAAWKALDQRKGIRIGWGFSVE